MNTGINREWLWDSQCTSDKQGRRTEFTGNTNELNDHHLGERNQEQVTGRGRSAITQGELIPENKECKIHKNHKYPHKQ